MNRSRLAALAGLATFTAALVGCNERGACIYRDKSGVEGACSEVKKSVCDEGKDRWIGGKCPDQKKTGAGSSK